MADSPEIFQIGKDEAGYRYRECVGATSNDMPIYKCVKGTETAKVFPA